MREDLFEEDDERACLSLAHWPFDAEHLDRLKPTWRTLVQTFLVSPEGQGLEQFLRQETLASKKIYPPQPLRLLELLDPENAHVVILGQDPYHGKSQAEGLAFSVAKGVRTPPSLLNIFKELERDLNQPRPQTFDASLMPWVQRGVFLLNHVLSVEEGQAASHISRGWEGLTNAILTQLIRQAGPRVFMLWGAQAQKQFSALMALQPREVQEEPNRLVLQANHPSPLSALRGDAPFMGCGHFSKAQNWLKDRGVSLSWSLQV